MGQGELEIGKRGGESSTLRLELPWPPSANHYIGYRVAGPFIKGKQFVQAYPTAKAKEFKDAVQRIVRRDFAERKWHGPLKMSAWTYPPDRRRRDTSNLLKCLEDALQDAGVFMDDYQIAEHHLWRTTHVVKDGKVIVELEPTVLL